MFNDTIRIKTAANVNIGLARSCIGYYEEVLDINGNLYGINVYMTNQSNMFSLNGEEAEKFIDWFHSF